MNNDIIIGSKKWAQFCERGTNAEYTFIIQLIQAARDIYPDEDPKEIVTSYMNRTPDYWRAFIEAALMSDFEFNPNRRV